MQCSILLKVTNRVELVDIIPDPNRSMCRFLKHQGSKLYVVDLGKR